MDINAGLKFLGPAYFVKRETFFAQGAPDPRVVLEKEGGLPIFPAFNSPKHILPQTERGERPARQYGAKGLEYWQAAFETEIPVICFGGRGRGKAPH